jgi:polyisoprenyl-phosphate glycosyltransferase
MNPQETLVSIVSAAHDESKVLEEMHRRLAEALDPRGVAFEWIVVDDGSSDGTFDVVRSLAARDPRVVGVRLSRSFGQQAALVAGMRRARGAAAVLMDADLQHPPECVPALVELWRAGHEVVVTRRRDAAHTGVVKGVTSRLFYAVLRGATGLDITTGSADFCLLDRRALDAVANLGERSIFLRGLVRWIGFRRATLEYDPHPRFAGRSSYSFRRMTRLALDGIFGFSALPTRVLFLACVLFSLSAVGYGCFITVAVVRGEVVPGWTSIMLVLLALGAVLCLGMGVLGEYIWRIFGEVRRRPPFIVAESVGGETARAGEGERPSRDASC